jgi:acetyl-CoA C-acetyltransferase
MLMSAKKAQALGLKPRARIISQALVGDEVYYHLNGPVAATQRVLDRAGMTIGDIDLFEVNEAFAAVVVNWARQHKVDVDKVNVNGGAIAIGHPIGASGARVLNTLLFEMKRRNAKKGLATLCIGGGMGVAMCVERD